MPSRDVDAVVRGERMLLDPAVRASADQVRSLLHPEFVEFGSSGHRFDAHSVAVAMEEAVAAGEEPAHVVDLSADQLGVDVVLVTYETHRRGTVTRRSSVWVRHDSGWCLRFHQGTVAAEP